jgi:membrane protease YdiL (CAAX protease family)
MGDYDFFSPWEDGCMSVRAVARPVGTRRRTRLLWEIAIVLGLSLGASAVYAIVALIAMLTEKTPLGDQSTALNPSQSPREWLDLTYQLLGVAFGLVPVLLVLFLLWRPGRSAFARLGFDAERPLWDLRAAGGLLLLIGIPGIGLYLAGRALGITVGVIASPPHEYWWSIPVLILAALRAALTEELIVVGYLFTRLAELGWSKWRIILSSAVLRGSYHLYQGIGPFIGNAAMGVVFGWCYARWGRTVPLVVTHWMLDIISFVGYPLALASWPALFAPAS